MLDCLRSVLALFRRVVEYLYEVVESVQTRHRLRSAAGNPWGQSVDSGFFLGFKISSQVVSRV